MLKAITLFRCFSATLTNSRLFFKKVLQVLKASFLYDMVLLKSVSAETFAVKIRIKGKGMDNDGQLRFLELGMMKPECGAYSGVLIAPSVPPVPSPMSTAPTILPVLTMNYPFCISLTAAPPVQPIPINSPPIMPHTNNHCLSLCRLSSPSTAALSTAYPHHHLLYLYTICPQH